MAEIKHIGRLRKRPGQSIFCINLQTGDISTVEGNKIVVAPYCIYRQALNRKNFIRKLVKEGFIKVTSKGDLVI